MLHSAGRPSPGRKTSCRYIAAEPQAAARFPDAALADIESPVREQIPRTFCAGSVGFVGIRVAIGDMNNCPKPRPPRERTRPRCERVPSNAVVRLSDSSALEGG